MTSAPIDQLTEPQRACLRLVLTHHNSKEIAGLLGVSPSAVDKRIERAVQIVRARSRFAAARMLADHEGTPIVGVAEGMGDRLPSEPFDVPPLATPGAQPVADGTFGLVRRLLGLSTGSRGRGRPRNDLTRAQRLGVVLAVICFVAVTSMAMLNMATTLSGILTTHRTGTPPR